MPVTFPSHAAAVLPWCDEGGALPPSALIVGSCAPDFAYLLNVRTNFHVWPGVLWPCVPLAVLCWLPLEGWVLPSLRRWLPRVRAVEWGRLATTRGLPTSGRGWAAALGALLLGIGTHLVWDGFTHALRFPASALYGQVRVGLWGHEVFVTQVLQVLSSVVGAGLVGRAAYRRYPRLPPVAERSRLHPGWLALVLLAAALTSWLALAWRIGVGHALEPLGAAWVLFWTLSRGLCGGLLVGSAVETWLARRAKSSVVSGAFIS
jgi:hypothetical protein